MSDGYCDVDFSDASDDADPVQFYDEKMVRARKAHVCSECRQPIAVGDGCRAISYRFEGKFWRDYQCLPCDEIAGEFRHRVVGFLWEHFDEEWSQGARLQACLDRLVSVPAKMRMRDQWLKWKGLASR